MKRLLIFLASILIVATQATAVGEGTWECLWGTDCSDFGKTTGFSECIYIEDPQTAEVYYAIWRAPAAVTLTAIWCEIDAGTLGLDLEIDDGAPTPVNGSDIPCDFTGGYEDSGLGGGANDKTMGNNHTLDLHIGTVVTAVRLSMCWDYTYD